LATATKLVSTKLTAAERSAITVKKMELEVSYATSRRDDE